jgi:hypothetical protein
MGWKRADFSPDVGHNVDGMTRGDKLLLVFGKKLISENDFFRGYIFEENAYKKGFVIPQWLLVFTESFYNDQIISLLFDAFIGNVFSAAVFRSSDLKPFEVTFVMGNPHLVSFGIPNSFFEFYVILIPRG